MEIKVVGQEDLLAVDELLSRTHIHTSVIDGRCIGLYSKEQIIGCCCYKMNPNAIVIDELFVAEKWRRRGLAYALMQNSVEIAKSHYSHEVVIVVVGSKHHQRKMLPLLMNKIGIKLNDNFKYYINEKNLLRKAKKAIKRYNVLKV